MIELAIAHALANPVVRLPRMAAIIMDKRRIVSKGWNRYRTHPLAARYSTHPERLCIHAELAAIVAARAPVEGMAMFIARIMKNGTPALAMPCAGCARAIAAFGIEKVVWTENNP